MNTKMRLTLCAAALLVPAWAAVRSCGGDDPGPNRGHVLLLDNDQVIKGDIERIGDQYRVHRHVGETWVPVDQVYCLCADFHEAYQRLRVRANLRDPDERVRLARWCQMHGLHQETLEELTAAVALNPEHAVANRLLESVRRTAALPTAARSRAPDADFDPLGLEIDSASLSAFTTHVQPILTNACARCHANGKGGSFKLVHIFDDAAVSHRATQQNLAAASAQINREHPLASPLLVRAIEVHGGAEQPPLKGGRKSAAYSSLEQWVRLTVSTVQPDGEPTVASKPSEEFHSGGEAAAPKVAPKAALKEGATNNFASAHLPAQLPFAGTPTDPFDPAIFNREMHPERTGEEPKGK